MSPWSSGDMRALRIIGCIVSGTLLTFLISLEACFTGRRSEYSRNEIIFTR